MYLQMKNLKGIFQKKELFFTTQGTISISLNLNNFKTSLSFITVNGLIWVGSS